MYVCADRPQVFKGVTALIKLLAAVDPDWAANSSGLMAALPLISLSYMVISRHRKQLSTAWGTVLRATGLEDATGAATGGHSGRGEGGAAVQATISGELLSDGGSGGDGGSRTATKEELRSQFCDRRVPELCD